jgi:superfamily I DNA and/or RNA helicase
MSRFAAYMGLGTSLHERLMNQSSEYVMLDCQYRMHTQISQFPCHQFYNAKVSDGINVTR